MYGVWRSFLHGVCVWNPKHGGREADASSHRAQTSHECSAPLDLTARQDAALLRKARAQEVLTRTMPEHAGRVIPKPPPGRDDKRVRPESQASHRPLSATGTPVAIPPDKESSKVKSKAEKLYEMNIRKLRSLAKPLDPAQKGQGEKRFFEWAGDERGEGIGKWEKEGKWDRKVERVCVMTVTTALQVRGKRLIGTGDSVWEADGSHDQAVENRSTDGCDRHATGKALAQEVLILLS